MCALTKAQRLLRAVAVTLAISRSVVSGFTSPNVIAKPVTTAMRGISKWNDEYQSADDDHDGLVTNEMFMRDMLAEPARRKKKGSPEYRPHDNRDALPFLVKVKTPDPYRRNSETATKKSSNAIAASIYARKNDGSLYKVLGQFELEKNTGCGDLLQVGDREFEVVTARSQFKYAGGKRFVMVRKVLEVKEINRIKQEATLTRLMKKGCESPVGKSFE